MSIYFVKFGTKMTKIEYENDKDACETTSRQPAQHEKWINSRKNFETEYDIQNPGIRQV